MSAERKTSAKKGKRKKSRRGGSAKASRRAKLENKTPTKNERAGAGAKSGDNKTPTKAASENKTPTNTTATAGSTNETPTESTERELSAREAAARLRRSAPTPAREPQSEITVPPPRSTAERRGTQPTVDGEIPPFWLRHDLIVLIALLAVLATGALLSQSMSEPPRSDTTEFGLSLDRPTALLALPEPNSESRAAGSPSPLPLAKTWVSLSEPSTKLTLLVDNRPTYNNLRGALAIARAAEYGEMVWVESADEVRIGGRDWLRTRYRYAHKPTKTDAPRLATAVELAALSGGLLYVVTAHGSAETVDLLYRLVAPSLTVDSNNSAANSALRSAPPPASSP